ncbi:MAG: tyrosine-type recombinase/integrase [Vicinamibacterales bacterium]
MREHITTEVIRKLPAGPVDIRDTKLSGFVVRVRATGSASYLVSIGRGCWHTIGPVETMKPHEAREEARVLLGKAAKHRTHGRDPVAERRRQRALVSAPTLKAFLADHYEPWALAHHKRGKETVQRLRTVFADLQSTKLSELTAWTVEKWRTQRLKQPRSKPATVNSHIVMLRAALAKAVSWRLLEEHPCAHVKPLTVDQRGRIRYLSPDEETRLRAALTARDERRTQKRAQANAWRRDRGYAEWPAENPDHLAPIVLMALNTGLRKGEIFGLRWTDVDLSRAQITIRGEGAKSGQTRYVPLNAEAMDVVTRWKATAENGAVFVFPGRREGESLDDVKKAWAPLIKAAKIPNFTFHDLRHSFASKLVMRGVDLNTVRELLGHADIKMTLRYAHLAPEHKAAAVARLVQR